MIKKNDVSKLIKLVQWLRCKEVGAWFKFSKETACMTVHTAIVNTLFKASIGSGEMKRKKKVDFDLKFQLLPTLLQLKNYGSIH